MKADSAARDEAHRRRLDMRRAYCLIDGQLHVYVRWTGKCSGCSCQRHDGQCSCPGIGCRECGYTGKRMRREAVPAPVSGPGWKVRGSVRFDDYRRMKEVFPDLTFRVYLRHIAGKDGHP